MTSPPTPGDRERIIAAAVRVGKMTISAPPPARHHTLINTFARVNREIKISPSDQGFLTNTGRFVDRHEAWGIAEDAEQIQRVTGPIGKLFSEDLW